MVQNARLGDLIPRPINSEGALSAKSTKMVHKLRISKKLCNQHDVGLKPQQVCHMKKVTIINNCENCLIVLLKAFDIYHKTVYLPGRA